MDWIHIEGLRVEARIGVHEWEHGWRRPLLLDIDLGLDLRSAAASDRLQDTIDYDAVSRTAAEVAAAGHYQLVERYADTLARAIFEAFTVDTLRLRVAKPGAVSAARTISVHMERQRSDYAPAAR